MFFDNLEELIRRVGELHELLGTQEVLSDMALLQKYSKELSEKEVIAEKYNEYKKALEAITDTEDILNSGGLDKEMRQMVQEELDLNQALKPKLEEDLKILLLPQDPHDNKNIYLEIRAGTGGDESALFCADLFRMYSKYAESMNWRVEVIEADETGIGGYKEIILAIKGVDVYSKLKFEAGGHRVQRIPETETSGRIHTSACTVAVLPEVEDVDIEILTKDLRIETFRAGGAGGQHVNTTDSAVRITHLPTGTVVSCQEERSQLKNRDRAMKLLKSRVLEAQISKQQSEISSNRKLQVGSGDRSERIRTYNFPQNRVTDHRINLTIYALDKMLEGDLNSLIESIVAYDQAERLNEAGL